MMLRRTAAKASRPAAHVASHWPSLAHASPAYVSYLQRVAGNQAVQCLVAVTHKGELASGPLSQPQVQRALAFYRAQPARYTREIIMQIQLEVGTVPTGRMTPLDVQAVAERQQKLNEAEKPVLKVDGMAGPRTLPSIFKIGLAKDVPLTSYTKKASKMWDDKSKSERDIAKDVVETLLNPRLDAEGIPPVWFKIVNNLGSRGVLRRSEWELWLDDLQFQPGDKHDLKETTATIYHEGRHAEQLFRVAQMLAGASALPLRSTAKQG